MVDHFMVMELLRHLRDDVTQSIESVEEGTAMLVEDAALEQVLLEGSHASVEGRHLHATNTDNHLIFAFFAATLIHRLFYVKKTSQVL